MMNTEDLLNQPGTNIDMEKRHRHKNLPWILGAATFVTGALIIRSLIHRSNKPTCVEPEQGENTTGMITTNSMAIQLLPLATLFLKTWLKKDETKKEVATA